MTSGDILSLLSGALVTIALSLVGILIGLPIGLGLALLRWADVPLVARLVALYVSMLRATPLGLEWWCSCPPGRGGAFCAHVVATAFATWRRASGARPG